MMQEIESIKEAWERFNELTSWSVNDEGQLAIRPKPGKQVQAMAFLRAHDHLRGIFKRIATEGWERVEEEYRAVMARAKWADEVWKRYEADHEEDKAPEWLAYALYAWLADALNDYIAEGIPEWEKLAQAVNQAVERALKTALERWAELHIQWDERLAIAMGKQEDTHERGMWARRALGALIRLQRPDTGPTSPPKGSIDLAPAVRLLSGFKRLKGALG